MMTKTGMLVVTNPNKILRILPRIQKEIQNTLYVQFFPEKYLRSWKGHKHDRPCGTGPLYSSIIFGLYSNTLSCRNLNVTVLLSSVKDPNVTLIQTKTPIDIVYFDAILNTEEMQCFVSKCITNKSTNCQIIGLASQEQHSATQPNTEKDLNCALTCVIYDSVVIGGTFDRLHAGHKVLLSEAVLRCQKKLTVGVTSTKMLKSKKLWELIEPCELRIQNVRTFLEDVDPALEYDVIPIDDMFGPTSHDPSFQMIVVSAETLGGGAKVNETRRAHGLNELVVHSVPLLDDGAFVLEVDDEEELKISSSNERLRLLGTRLRVPQVRPHLPVRPYVIGLTGGIASGKSTVADRLKALGAAVVDCDRLAHRVYEPGSICYRQLVEQFGVSILDPDGAVDRRVLGAIVFSDKAQLDKLNSLVWPALLVKIKEQIACLHRDGHRIVVCEAAVLLRAGWESHCHEVWVCIIPPDEAVRRLVQRNNLTETEAASRIASQPTNSEQVSCADLVFCTLWRPAFTHKQVLRAWHETNARLDHPL